MPLKSYGVLIARVVDRRREGDGQSPHFQVHVADDAGTGYRIAVNVKSQEQPSELLYLVDDDFRHPVTAMVEGLGGGWTVLASAPGTAALDFVRGNLFDRSQMRTLPADAAGPDDDLADLLEHYVQRAVADPAARAFAFGERWGPEEGIPDKIFGFTPGNGVHDIHMNQGNHARFWEDDGVRQDGALLLHFPAQSRWVAIFLAFQSQAWHTDDTTGHSLDVVDTGLAPVRIVAALVNPTGPSPEAEAITLVNASPDPVDLTGWRIADGAGHSCAVPTRTVAAGACAAVPLTPEVQLGNHGGVISLLDAHGIKVHGVSYTSAQSEREGWTVVF
ncbi:MAG TPA: DUF2278 family protein [Acidimicrobiales bacterium]|nr:DUF2278 family protein [Acidimicrobiales bacterium]